MIVYCLADPRTREARYVGVTKNAKARLKRHITDGKRGGHTHRSRWIRSLLDQGVEPEMVELEACDAGWDEPEKHWIAYLKFLGARLVNANEGGHCAPVAKSEKPWVAGINGVFSPSALFLRQCAQVGVSAEKRQAARARLKRMSDADRCLEEMRLAMVMESSGQQAGRLAKWIKYGLPRAARFLGYDR